MCQQLRKRKVYMCCVQEDGVGKQLDLLVYKGDKSCDGLETMME